MRQTELSSVKNIHFMGIGGSGMSAVAMISLAYGYEVSGCDVQRSTPYLRKLKKAKIKLYTGHDEKHLKGIDVLAVTPSALYTNKDHSEIIAGAGKMMTWQEFMGRYLQSGKKVICIAGTHGKSTTTAMVGLLYENSGLDPTVEVGATVKEWYCNYRVGKSDIFINEADEFYGNFLHYHPDAIVINNIEFDHPDYFMSYAHVLDIFNNFVKNLTRRKLLVLNQDSAGIYDLIDRVPKSYLKNLKIVGYTLGGNAKLNFDESYRAEIVYKNPEYTSFRVIGPRGFNRKFMIKLPGEHNVQNALGVIALAEQEGISTSQVKKLLKNFNGVGRRLEFVGQKRGAKVYDDYAHHPTEIRASLESLRQIYPKARIIGVVEPHMFSRTRRLLNEYKNAFTQAERVIITPIYASRDTKTFGVNSDSIVKISKHENISSARSMKDALYQVVSIVKKGDVILVMGAGDSYKLTRDILNAL